MSQHTEETYERLRKFILNHENFMSEIERQGGRAIVQNPSQLIKGVMLQNQELIETSIFRLPTV